jgi:hypothetical protein
MLVRGATCCKVPDSGMRPARAGGRVRPIHLQRVPGSRGQRPHLHGIGNARIDDSEEEALRASGPDAVYYATRLRGALNEKARRELEFRPRALKWI